MSWLFGKEAQLRVPSALVGAVPDGDEGAWHGEAGKLRWETTPGDEYSWRDDQALFSISTAWVDVTSEDDPLVNVSLSNPVTPGPFSIWSDTGEIDEEIRWGTGTERDGTPHDLSQVAGFLPENEYRLRTAFEASGMYCFDLTAEATLTAWDWDNYDEESWPPPKLPGGTPVTATKTIRIAVGDEVAADAACGTATNETPQAPASVPDAPGTPTTSLDGQAITVNWQAPAADGGAPLTGYTVTLTNDVDPALVSTVDADTTSAVFEDLPSGRYRAKVVASNEHGDSRASEWSHPVTLRPKGESTLIVASGHIDAIAPQVKNDESGGKQLVLRAHHDDYDWLNWDDFVLYSNDTAKQTLPAQYRSDSDWSFIGEAGSDVWVSPQTNRAGLPWVGLSTEHESILDTFAHDDALSFRIEGVTGHGGGDAPGAFAVAQSNEVSGPAINGTKLYGSTLEGLPSTLKAPPGMHSHYSWYFTQPGVYCIAAAVDAKMPDGVRQTARGQLTHVVGNAVDPATVEPCGTVADYPETGAPRSKEPANEDALVFDGGFGNLSIGLEKQDLQARLLHSSSYRNAIPTAYDLENVIFRGALHNFLEGQNDGRFYFGREEGRGERDTVPYLGWNTFGVLQKGVDGDLNWKVSRVQGPGNFAVVDHSSPILDTAQGLKDTELWAQSGERNPEWYVTKPGKYCIDLAWSAKTREYGPVEVSKTITVVADGDGFTHDDSTLTQTCADGAEATEPGDDPEPNPEPGDDEQPWNVPNWTETESGAKILNLGHVDVASVLTDGKLDTKVKDTTVEGAEAGRDDGWVSWHEPEDTVFQLLPGAETTVSSREEFRFLGEPGSRIWRVNDTQDFSLLWPGWSTEHIAGGVVPEGVDWKLTGAEGPGEFFLYQLGMDGVDVHFNTADGIDDSDSVHINERAHVHGSWAFTAEGVYCLAFERSAKVDGAKQADEFELAVAVGETDPTKVDPKNCAGSEQVVTVPNAPAKPTASVDGDAVTVKWVAPADGGSPITGYTVQLLGGAQPLVKDVAGDALEVSFEGLPAGSYTATVIAVNEIGSSAASPASDAVTVAVAVDPDPTDPTDPEPSDPDPSDPEPTDPTPTDPTDPKDPEKPDDPDSVTPLPDKVTPVPDAELGEWLADTGAGPVFPLAAGAGILLLLGAVILVSTAKRRRETATLKED
ncbi:MAG: choice-of-anchor M domain-containing protein [Leucobacter sp.]